MRFVTVLDTKSLAILGAPCTCLVPGHTARIDGHQRTDRIRPPTPSLQPHLNLNRVGMFGFQGGADFGKCEDIIV